jgi:hypothetical protein
MGFSNGFSVPPICAGESGWNVYVLDLKTIGIVSGSHDWTGTIRELLLHPFAGTGTVGATIKLDWARLTTADPRTARPYTIQWTGNGTGGPVTLYASPNDTLLDADDIVITTNQSAGDGSFTFQTGVLPAGRYYIAASNTNGTAWSSGPLIINAPPQVTLTRPSMTSGQEYAANEIGNAWDMSDVADVNYNLMAWEKASTCVSNESFSGGIYSAQIPNCPAGSPYSDPILYLGGLNRYLPGTADPVIDTSKYRYLSYRYYHSGQQNVADGWVARLGWWRVAADDGTVLEPPVMSRDVIIQEGWNTYKLDLWAADLLDEAYPPGTPSWTASHPNRLRFDPDELAAALTPATIQLDWIKLNAMDEVSQGGSFPIEFTLAGTLPVTVTFYYDPDTNPSNGRFLIGTQAALAAGWKPAEPGAASDTVAQIISSSGMTQTVFLPVIARNLIACSGNCYIWNTAGVPKGTYYICTDAWDAHNAAYRCSEAPVVVK